MGKVIYGSRTAVGVGARPFCVLSFVFRILYTVFWICIIVLYRTLRASVLITWYTGIFVRVLI